MDLETLRDIAEKSIQLSPGNLKEFREGHLHLFAKNGFETPHQDFYKFTSLKTAFQNMDYAPQNVDVDFEKFLFADFPTLILKDGLAQNLDLKINGIKFSTLKEQLPKIQNAKNRNNALTHLHHSLMTEGVCIEIEKNAKFHSPLRILNLVSNCGLATPTILIHAHPHSECTIIEETIGLCDSYTNISETHICVESGAKLEHIQIEAGTKASLHHGSTFSQVEKDATYRNLVFHLSGKLNRRNLDLHLLSSGAHGESYNLYLTNENEHSDINTAINHLAADSTSCQIAKGILDGESKAVFTGLIHIFPQAQRVASGQLNKNLLLSNKAQAHSQPQLEIFADDVKCSHGSTTGQLSEDELFYFEARGIPREKARTLLAHGFGMEIVLKIANLKAQEKVADLILEKLRTKFKIGGEK